MKILKVSGKLSLTKTMNSKKIQEKNPLYLEFSLRLPSGDLVEFENDEDDVVVNIKTKIQ